MESAEFLKVFAHDTRLRIVALLLNHELCVCELEEILLVKQVNISKHLNKLKEAHVVSVRKEKQRAFYYLSDHFYDNKVFINYIEDILTKDALLLEDYKRFIAHEEVKDQQIYVCNVFKKENMS